MVEYAVLFTAVVAALGAMGIYVKRAVSGRLRGASENIGEAYDPRQTTGSYTLDTDTDVHTRVRTVNEFEVVAPQDPANPTCFDLNGNGRCDAHVGATVAVVPFCVCVNPNSNVLCFDTDCGCASDPAAPPPSAECAASVKVPGDRASTARSGSETVGPLGSDLWN